MIDAEGNFTAEFTEAVPGFLGEDHKDSKVMTDITSIGQLTKAYADNKSALGRKMDNIIQKPAEDADDEAKAAYKTTLHKELGVPDAPEEYTFPELKDPEGYRDGSKEYWADVFKKNGVSQELATNLTNALHEMQRHNAEADNTKATEAGEKQLNEEIAAVDEMYPGDLKPEALRHALTFIDKFGTEALQGAVKEAKLFDNHELKDWAPLVNLNSLPLLVNAGKAMSNNTMPTGEPTKMGSATGPQVAAIAALNKQTVEEVQGIIAQFPNSWNDGVMLRLPE